MMESGSNILIPNNIQPWNIVSRIIKSINFIETNTEKLQFGTFMLS